MQVGFRSSVVLVLVAAASLVIHADGTPPSQAADVQFQLGTLFYSEGRYIESLEAFQNALKSTDTLLLRSARAGVVQAALRVAEFDTARHEAEALVKVAPGMPMPWRSTATRCGRQASSKRPSSATRKRWRSSPELPRGLHGMARSLLARSQLDEAMNQAQAALRLSPRDLEIHHTVGAIYERMHKYEEAAAAYGNYVNLLPNKDTSEKAAWSRAEIRFLRSFAQRVPFQADPGTDDMVFTVDFRLVNDKVVVRARVNDASPQDFVVDTGAESTVITEPTARRLGVAPITYTLSAGVGETGLRGLQLARVDSLELGTLKLRNVPCIIKSPPLRDLPIARNREPVADLARLLDDHRLQVAQAHLRQAPADRAGRSRAAAARLPSGHRARSRRARTPGELRRGHGRRGHLHQPGHRQPAAGEGRRRARSRCASTARRDGTATRS